MNVDAEHGATELVARAYRSHCQADQKDEESIPKKSIAELRLENKRLQEECERVSLERSNAAMRNFISNGGT